MSLYTVNDISAKANCSITSMFPTTRTASGGKFADGTNNVEIHCSCTDVNNTASDYVQWYDPDGERVLEKLHHNYTPGIPYYEKILENYVLVIPTFNESYDGVYTCAAGNSYSYDESEATVDLKLDGKHIASYVATVCTKKKV